MNTFAKSIKYWRNNRGLSQLDLSLDADVSSKHISFLETGKSLPSKKMVIHLSQVLNIPLFERNRLLSQSGFATIYSKNDLQQVDMQPVYQAISLILENHNPYPAVVLDWDWNLLMDNTTFQMINAQIRKINPNFSDNNNFIELLFDPNGYRPFIENWEEFAYVLLQRIYRERSFRPDQHNKLLNNIFQFPEIPADWKKHISDSNMNPMLSVILNIGEVHLKLFSTLATFGTPVDITMQELVIEQYFPADELTKQFFNSLTLSE